MKTYSILLLTLIVACSTSKNNIKTVKWKELVVKDFLKEWSNNLQDSILIPQYTSGQKALNGSKIKIKGYIFDRNGGYFLISPESNTGHIHYPSLDGVIELTGLTLTDDEIKALKLNKKPVELEGQFKIYYGSGLYQLPYNIQTPKIIE